MNIDKLNNEELTHFVITGEIKGGCVEAQVFSHFSYVGRNKPVRATARTGVSGKHHPNSPETPPRATRLDGLIPAYAQEKLKMERDV